MTLFFFLEITPRLRTGRYTGIDIDTTKKTGSFEKHRRDRRSSKKQNQTKPKKTPPSPPQTKQNKKKCYLVLTFGILFVIVSKNQDQTQVSCHYSKILEGYSVGLIFTVEVVGVHRRGGAGGTLKTTPGQWRMTGVKVSSMSPLQDLPPFTPSLPTENLGGHGILGRNKSISLQTFSVPPLQVSVRETKTFIRHWDRPQS